MSLILRRLGLALLLGAHGAPASSQQEPDRPPAIGARAELVLVDVIVTDKRGQPVTDLARDAFLVFEDGRPVEVAMFRAPSPSSPAGVAAPAPSGTPETAPTTPATEPATIVIYLENDSLTPGGRRQVLEAVRSFIGERLPSGGFRALVIAGGGGARTTTKITTTVAEIEGALETIGRTTGGGALSRSDERQVVDMMRAIIETCENTPMCGNCLDVLEVVIGTVRVHAEARTRTLSRTIARLSAAVSALGTLPGRKALVYASQDFEQRPGMHLFNQIGDICPEALHKDAFRVLGPIEEYDVMSELRELTARANAARVTFYPLDAAGLEGYSAGDASYGERRYTPSPRTDTLRRDNVRATQELLAQETGGFAIVNANDASKLLGKLPDDLASRYDLGFVPAREPDGRRHSIKVRLQHGKGLSLRYRGSYFHAPQGAREGNRLLAALLYGLEEDGLGAAVTAEIAWANQGREAQRVALVRISVPLAKLATEPDGNGRRARLRLVLAIRQKGGAPTDPPLELREKHVEMHLTDDGSAPPAHEFVVEVPLGEGEHDLAVGVHDALSTRATYRTLHLR